MKKIIIILFISAIILGLGILFLPPLSLFTSDQVKQPEQPEIPIEQPISIKISAVGDIMVHEPQYKAAYNSETNTYDFTENFIYVKPYIQAADLAICNLETVFAGGEPQGYPAFNAPDSLAEAIKSTGFDVALLSNNHILDKGIDGMLRTIDVVNKAGISSTGAHKLEDKQYIIKNVKGINIGIVSYTYETPSVNGRKTLNSNIISERALPLLNTFSYETLDADVEKVKANIDAAKADGAQVIICYFHWGEEYQQTPNEFQTQLASSVSKAGADIIFASHPHVLQSVNIITDETSKKETAVFYSMGNFISNQRTETLKNRYTEEGIIAKVSFDIMKSTGIISDYKVSAVPIWVEKHKGKTTEYAVIPLDKDFSQNPALIGSGHLSRAKVALSDIIKIVGSEFVEREEIK